MVRFDDQGRLVIPRGSKTVKEFKNYKKLWVVKHAYCINGHSLIDTHHFINGYPGIHLEFRRGHESGEIVISAHAADLRKIVLSGTLEPGQSYELSCPLCHVKLPILMPCECKGDGRFVIIGLTPQLDFSNAITLCNVEGCTNGAIISSGEVIRHTRVEQGR